MALKGWAMRRRQLREINIDELDRLSRTELRALWTQEFGEKPPATIGRDVLALGVAYARQELVQGGLAKPLARELDRLLDRALNNDPNEASSALTTPLPRTGTVLVREWQGATHHVTIVADGYVWNGHPHRSLSSIARAITGTKWSGPRFFGMREANTKATKTRRGA
jgi:hypothetical protein